MGPERITANLGFLKTFESQRSRRLSSRIDSPLGTKRRSSICHSRNTSFQNLCHVRCSHSQGLRFYTEPCIYMVFDCIKFVPQFLYLEHEPDMIFYWLLEFFHIFPIPEWKLGDFFSNKRYRKLCMHYEHSSRGIRRCKFEEEVLYFEFSKPLSLSNPNPSGHNSIADFRFRLSESPCRDRQDHMTCAKRVKNIPFGHVIPVEQTWTKLLISTPKVYLLFRKGVRPIF